MVVAVAVAAAVVVAVGVGVDLHDWLELKIYITVLQLYDCFFLTCDVNTMCLTQL